MIFVWGIINIQENILVECKNEKLLVLNTVVSNNFKNNYNIIVRKFHQKY